MLRDHMLLTQNASENSICQNAVIAEETLVEEQSNGDVPKENNSNQDELSQVEPLDQYRDIMQNTPLGLPTATNLAQAKGMYNAFTLH